MEEIPFDRLLVTLFRAYVYATIDLKQDSMRNVLEFIIENLVRLLHYSIDKSEQDFIILTKENDSFDAKPVLNYSVDISSLQRQSE